MNDWKPSARQGRILKQLLARGDVWIFDLDGFDASRGYYDRATYNALEGLRKHHLIAEGIKRYSVDPPPPGEWQNWSIRLTPEGKRLARAH